jgi:AraC family transcriptional regulator
MQPRIETLKEKKLVGKRIKMSMADNKTFELWRNFMPKRNEIKNNIGSDLFSMQVFDPGFNFQNFNLKAEFYKWAVKEVTDFDAIPEDMEAYTLTGGLYAVFLHKGPASEGARTFRYIFETWIPNSEYIIDDRAHFEILGEKYKPESPDSEEDVYIPIKLKTQN